MFKRMNNDINVILERDPAARTKFEVFLTYPGLHAIWVHRISHWLWLKNWKIFSRWLAYLNRFFTGVDIHPGAQLGKGIFIDHGMGVVIGETAEVKDNVTIYHGVTLGGVNLNRGKRHPTIEEDVVIGAGAKVLGAIIVGRGSRIGANSVVVKSVPLNSIVVGVPGQVIKRSKFSTDIDLRHDQLPDAIGISISSLIQRLEKIEAGLEQKSDGNKIHAPEHGVWQGEDFMI